MALFVAGAACISPQPSFGDEGLVKWMRNTKRDPFPDTVRFKVLELRHERAYWVSINRIDRWGSPAEVFATRVNRKRIRVSTTNVGELTLHLDRRQMRLAPALTVELNGKEQAVEGTDQQEAKLTLAEPGKLCKRKGLCGPFSELLEHRFVLVYPSKGQPDDTDILKTPTGRFLIDWQAFSTGLARLKLDAQVDDADIAGANLILFGTPATNTFLARIADKLPIRFADGKYVVGKQSYPDSLGLIFIYPNPLNPDRMIAVCSGPHYGEKLPVNHKYDLIPDYVVYEAQPDSDDTNWWRCAGLFDSNWQLDEALMETQGPAPPPPPQAEPAPPAVPGEQPAPEPVPAKP